MARGLKDLAREDRMLLLRFVCSFAWADLEVRPEERSFVARLVRRLGLSEEECAEVEEWLEVPPEPETVDPTQVPHEHRALFVHSAESVVTADGEVAPEEREQLILLSQLLR